MGKKKHKKYDESTEHALDNLNAILDGDDDADLADFFGKTGKKKKDKDDFVDIDRAISKALKATANRQREYEPDDSDDELGVDYSQVIDEDETEPEEECLAYDESNHIVRSEVSVKRINEMGYDLMILSDGIRSVTVDLRFVKNCDREEPSVEKDMVSGYAMAFMRFMLPAFIPQAVLNDGILKSASYSGAPIDDNENYHFYDNNDGNIMAYYISPNSITNFIDACDIANDYGYLKELFMGICDMVMSPTFAYTGKYGTYLPDDIDNSSCVQFMEDFLNHMKNVEPEDGYSSAENVYDAICESVALPMNYMYEVNSFLTMFSDEDTEDDVSDEGTIDTSDDEVADEEIKIQSVTEHMKSLTEYALNQSNDEVKSDDEDDTEEDLLSDIDGVEDVDVTVNSVDDGVEAHVSVSKSVSEPKNDDGDGEFIVRRR